MSDHERAAPLSGLVIIDCTQAGDGETPPLLKLMSDRSTVNACWIVAQKSSSSSGGAAKTPGRSVAHALTAGNSIAPRNLRRFNIANGF